MEISENEVMIFEMMIKRDPDPNEIRLENQSNLLDLTQKKINKICRQLHESRELVHVPHVPEFQS